MSRKVLNTASDRAAGLDSLNRYWDERKERSMRGAERMYAFLAEHDTGRMMEDYNVYSINGFDCIMTLFSLPDAILNFRPLMAHYDIGSGAGMSKSYHFCLDEP